MSEIRLVYPYPMHLGLGYTYMLSIAQSVNALAHHCKVDLLTLDTRRGLERFYRQTLNEEPAGNLEMIQVSNRRFGLKSNTWFFRSAVMKHVRHRLGQNERVGLYSRDLKQLDGLMKGLGREPGLGYVLEAHQVLSQNLCRNGLYAQAKRQRALEQRVFGGIHGLVCITPTLSTEISRLFPNVTQTRTVEPVGVAEKFFMAEASESPRYDLVYAGNFSRWKGVDTLIDALARVAKVRPDLRVLLVGAHEHQRGHYRALVHEYGLDAVVTLQERLPLAEIPAVLGQARVGIVSVSYQEDGLLYTSPLKLYEYLAAGLRVVASQVPSLMASLPDGLVHWALPDNAESMADAMLSALSDERHNRADRIAFAREYRWDRRAGRLADFIDKCLESA